MRGRLGDRRRGARWTAALAGALACAALGCQSADGLGVPFRLNEKEGEAGTFTRGYYTAIVARGASVAAAWLDRNGPKNRDVAVRRSLDGGRTWSEAFHLNDGEYANTVSVRPRLALLPGPGELLAVWQSRRNEAGQKFVLARRSTDLGATWEPVERLNFLPQSFLPDVAVREDGAVLVAYDDERNVNRDIFVNRSLDGGATWLERDVRVDRMRRTESGAPAAAIAADDTACVVWEERPRPLRGRRDVRPRLLAACSRDVGRTWGPPRDVVPPGEGASPLWPQLVASGRRFTVAWSAGELGESRKSWLYLSSSSDGGTTWSAPVTAYEGETYPQYQLVSSGDHVYLVWDGGEAEQPGAIYFNSSDDGGASWRRPWTEPLRIDRPEVGRSRAFQPRLAVQGSREVAVVWQEDDRRVLLALSRDGGRTWPTSPIEVARREGEETLRFPQVAVGADAAYVLWERWGARQGEIRSLADVNRPTPHDVFVRRVALP